MLILIGVIAVLGGTFGFLWYRTVVGLPAQRQPLFVHNVTFNRVVAPASLLAFVLGTLLLGSVRLWYGFTAALVAAVVALLIIKFDRHSAQMRVIYDRYWRIRRANPSMDEIEVLFCTAQWRYPGWSHDRVLELVAGKDIENLILLMIVRENRVNPITDWELYRSLKSKVERLVHTT